MQNKTKELEQDLRKDALLQLKSLDLDPRIVESLTYYITTNPLFLVIAKEVIAERESKDSPLNFERM